MGLAGKLNQVMSDCRYSAPEDFMKDVRRSLLYNKLSQRVVDVEVKKVENSTYVEVEIKVDDCERDDSYGILVGMTEVADEIDEYIHDAVGRAVANAWWHTLLKDADEKPVATSEEVPF